MTDLAVSVGAVVQGPDGAYEIVGTRMEDGINLAQVRIGDRFAEMPLAQALTLFARLAPAATDTEPWTDLAFMQSLTKAQRQKVLEREGHVLMVRDGIPAHPGADQRYLDTVPSARRVDHKAEELGVARSTVNRWVAAYGLHGRAGLLHGNTSLPVDALDRLPGEVLALMRAHVARERGASKKTLTNEYAMVLDDLRRAGLARGASHE